MPEITLPSIDKHLAPYKDLSILMLVSENDIKQRKLSQEELRISKKINGTYIPNNLGHLTLRNRLDAYYSRVVSEGGKIDCRRPFDLSDIDLEDYDALLFTGRIVYQTAITAQDFSNPLEIPLFIEFHEMYWDSVAESVMAKMIDSGSEWIAESLCYLSANPKTPKRITL